MPRLRKPPRLYLDTRRRQWVIRDRDVFIRTGFGESEKALAEQALGNYPAVDLPPQSVVARIPEIVANAAERRAWNIKARREQGLIVYFITADYPEYPIKIGFTASVREMRLRTLQTGCPYPLILLGQMRGTIEDEKSLHTKFAHLKLQGEWFQRDATLLAYIRATCSNVVELAA